MPPGQPTKYDPKYCGMLIKHLEQGYSFESFAALIDVSEDTIYEWCKIWPEFSEAKSIGRPKSRLLWEQIGRAGTNGEIENFNCSAWIFNMKNRFKWRDKQPEEIDETKAFVLAYEVKKKPKEKK